MGSKLPPVAIVKVDLIGLLASRHHHIIRASRRTSRSCTSKQGLPTDIGIYMSKHMRKAVLQPCVYRAHPPSLEDETLPRTDLIRTHVT